MLILLVELVNSVQASNLPDVVADSSHYQQKIHFHDPWLAPDKGLHFLGSMMVTIAVAKTSQQYLDYPISKSRNFAFAFSFSLGLSKECYDATKPRNFFSWKDLMADGLGTLVGGLILALQ